MESKVSFFLGANTPAGFYSLYDQLLAPDTARRVYLLKGGPGCGKSSLMRRVARALESGGEPVEYILCSGDPDSLDAVIFPNLGAAIVDATAPHGGVPKSTLLARVRTRNQSRGRRKSVSEADHGYRPRRGCAQTQAVPVWAGNVLQLCAFRQGGEHVKPV